MTILQEANRWLHSTLAVLVIITIASASPAGAQPPEPPPPAPLVNRVNELLPPWLRLRGEFRERVEGFANQSFDDERDDLY